MASRKERKDDVGCREGCEGRCREVKKTEI